jgi:surface protein
MSAMFHEASQFNGDLSRLDVYNVTNMRFVFDGASVPTAQVSVEVIRMSRTFLTPHWLMSF